MSSWRFYQGLRGEWRWYHFDDTGAMIGEADQAFAELKACMQNAEAAGFEGDAYQVHARPPGGDTTIIERRETPRGRSGEWNGSPPKK